MYKNINKRKELATEMLRQARQVKSIKYPRLNYFTIVSLNTFISLNNFITYKVSHVK